MNAMPAPAALLPGLDLPLIAHDPGGKTRLVIPPNVRSRAVFSPDEVYRYELERVWEDEPEGGLPLFLLCNPSTADLQWDDPTNFRVRMIATGWGYGGYRLGNFFGYRLTEMDALRRVADPVGPENVERVLRMARESPIVIIGHGRLPGGKTGGLVKHARALVGQLQAQGTRLHVLRESDDGNPWHPLFLPATSKPIVWGGYR